MYFIEDCGLRFLHPSQLPVKRSSQDMSQMRTLVRQWADLLRPTGWITILLHWKLVLPYWKISFLKSSKCASFQVIKSKPSQGNCFERYWHVLLIIITCKPWGSSTASPTNSNYIPLVECIVYLLFFSNMVSILHHNKFLPFNTRIHFQFYKALNVFSAASIIAVRLYAEFLIGY